MMKNRLVFRQKLEKKLSNLSFGRDPSGQGHRLVALGRPTSLGHHHWSSNQGMNNMGVGEKRKRVGVKTVD
jgi:hypothetical protein